eukprot:gnl/TRDRNA2_/TRDRNA2_80415_c0_seq2.p1 gnl/TRDRNA2_/TRDRNA2_80415_c0~~gnl/TRDRNA2_/TRDRNA2_80415_c0_seq2.p1  ORF type:complete len:576 (-),score=135.68 gnl/TRDRNA2_/TRDRNA2_80415_c0_seq2:56-1783(-)
MRAAAADGRAGHGNASMLRLTPKRFVQFMRNAQRRNQRKQHRDPVEKYVEQIFTSGHLRKMSVMPFEKKLYTDVARIICFAFDRALLQANGTSLWGHELRVKAVVDSSGEGLDYGSAQSRLRVEQVEAVVDAMLQSEDLQVPPVLDNLQRQLLVNCSILILQLIEDLTSKRAMQVTILGHSLNVQVAPDALSKLLVKDTNAQQRRFRINKPAIDALVDAIIEDSEVQNVLVPDLIEAEVYRVCFQRMLFIAQEILGRLRIRLFGVEVRLGLIAEENYEDDASSEIDPAEVTVEVLVSESELRSYLSKLEDERRRIEKEIEARHEEDAAGSAIRDSATARAKANLEDTPADSEEAPVGTGEPMKFHEFRSLAQQDRLARTLNIQRTVAVPVDIAYEMLADVDGYPSWMPMCTSAQVRSREELVVECDVGFGIETGTMLGMLGDTVRYRVMLRPPGTVQSSISKNPGARAARIVADASDGFAYGKRLVYDWRFLEVAPGETDVRLDLFFQAKTMLYLPIWDSMQATVTGVMMRKFTERGGILLSRRSDDVPSDFKENSASAAAVAHDKKVGQQDLRA